MKVAEVLAEGKKFIVSVEHGGKHPRESIVPERTIQGYNPAFMSNAEKTRVMRLEPKQGLTFKHEDDSGRITIYVTRTE
jgi:hypothetical protein